MQINRDKLLQAAARFDSQSSGSGSDSDSGSNHKRARHKTEHKKYSSKRKSKHSSSKKSQRSHKRAKRSDHEKIAELEQRAAAMGASNALPSMGRMGFGRYSSTFTAVSGDSVTLDTSGDANNALYESLYGCDVPRYNRMDPLDLVRVSRRLGVQQLGDTNLGNAAADRYYRGRHFLQERSRSAKRINLAALQHRSSSTTFLQRNSTSTILLPPTMPLLPPAEAGTVAASTGRSLHGGLGAAHMQEQHAGRSRRLAMPAPAFIPLEAPQELLQQSEQQREGVRPGDAGSWRQQQQHVYAAAGNRLAGIAPTELVEQAGLTPDELLLQATRAWNVAARERPHDEELWLDFAAFQHSAAQQQPQRGRGVNTGLLDPVTAEKQISLLTKGLAHHPSSTRLLLALLRCYASVAPDADALEAKWAGVLSRQGGSWELWREYIALRQANFADFKVSGLQKVYQDALHSLQVELLGHRRKAATAHKQQHKQQLPDLTQQQLQQMTPLAAAAATSAAAVSGSSSSNGLGLAVTLGEQALELQLVQLLLALMLAELEAGYTEHALAQIQALLEFHLFPPELPPGGVSALLRLFAAYWSAGVPRIGEAGARGWAYWCCWQAMGMEQPAAAADDDAAAKEEEQQEPAGWGGWFEVPQAAREQDPTAPGAAAPPASQQHGQSTAAVSQADADAAAEEQQQQQGKQAGSGSDDSAAPTGRDNATDVDDEQQSEEGQLEQQQEEEEEDEVDEDELMRQLGLQLEQQLQEVERQGLPADVLARWVLEEASCCSSQWQPLRPGARVPTSTADPAEPTEAEDSSSPDPTRIAGSDCVEPCLFLLRSAAALRRLVLGCVELLGVQLSLQGVPWCSSNSPTPMQQQAVRTAASLGRTSSGGGGGRVSSWSNAAADGAGGDASAAHLQQQQRWQECRQVPWYAASDERWQWVVHLLQRLVADGPCSDWQELCQALMVLQASKPSDAALTAAADADANTALAGADAGSDRQRAGVGGESCPVLQQLTLDGAAAAAGGVPVSNGSSSSGGSTWPSQQQLSAGRAAAKQLLSDQQENLWLYDAYGCLEAAAGQVKTARKVFETALALATAAAAPGGGSAGAQQDSAAAAAAAPTLALHLTQLELTAGGKAGLSKAHTALHALLAGQQLQVAAAAEAAVASKQQAQQQQQSVLGLLADSHLRDARVKFQQRIPELVASAGGALTPAAASTVAAAALFELVVGLRKGDEAAGLSAAVAVCKQVTAAVPEAVRATSAQHEQLVTLQCHMLAAAATGNRSALAPALNFYSSSSSGSSTVAGQAALLAAAVPPARAREALGAALQLYPHSKALLQLQVGLDHACYTLSGLRRQLAVLMEVNPSPGLWAVALQAEALRPGGGVRLGVLFERALAAPTFLQWHQHERLQRQRTRQAWATACAAVLPAQQQQRGQQQQQELLMQPVTAEGSAAALLDLAVWDGYRGWGHCAGLWQQYMQYELGLGRLDAARKLFLRAVHAVPGAKGLWLSGFGGVCAGLQPRECSGLLNVMLEREVVVRTDVYEVLLAAMADKQQMQLE